jgi:acetyl esterase/lipase
MATKAHAARTKPLRRGAQVLDVLVVKAKAEEVSMTPLRVFITGASSGIGAALAASMRRKAPRWACWPGAANRSPP